MIESHLTKKAAVHRKPRFRNGKVYCTYLRLEYEVYDGYPIMGGPVWIFKIRREGFNL
jgi:hypothetical protein